MDRPSTRLSGGTMDRTPAKWTFYAVCFGIFIRHFLDNAWMLSESSFIYIKQGREAAAWNSYIDYEYFSYWGNRGDHNMLRDFGPFRKHNMADKK
mmetsp:Transcript_45724/g.46202  ORF Transcript_45724/g.46202 Transcript_45724/m.46202 type:complete len:95 (-) Transcript_45724:152-436(-)